MALRLSDEMQQRGLQHDVITYSAQISACGKGRMTARAWLLSDVVQQQGLWPIVITYSALISAQCFE